MAKKTTKSLSQWCAEKMRSDVVKCRAEKIAFSTMLKLGYRNEFFERVNV